ncbi:MAG: hypothetical protein ISS76_23130 [Phycisphaerae bacterium]|nr:hypothetical protein [Phycisphaerae bacterium]
MRDFSRRLKSIEKKLNLNKEHKIINIIHYGDELPPDSTTGNTTIHFVMYDEICKEKDQQ